MSTLDTLTDAELDQLGHAIKTLMANLNPDLRVTDILSPKELHMMHRVFRWLAPARMDPSTQQKGGKDASQDEETTGT